MSADRPSSDSLHFLGRSVNRLPDSPSVDILDTFPNQHPESRYWVQLEFREFSSLCPVTGMPDSAEIRVRYRPGEVCVETKSLKFYLAAFRNVPAFNEEVVNRILTDLVVACKPREMVVRGSFASRGGIRLTAQVCHPADSAIGKAWERE